MGNTTKKAFPVLNMHCAGCANNVEKTVKKLPGVIEASVNFATNTLTVSYEKEQLTPGEIRAAVLAAGTCGFGMGATPNAMANMQALTEKYVPSVKAYLLVPIIGSMFADFLNSLTITFFTSSGLFHSLYTMNVGNPSFPRIS